MKPINTCKNTKFTVKQTIIIWELENSFAVFTKLFKNIN